MALIDRNEAIDAIWKTEPLTYAGCIDAINALDEKIIRCGNCIKCTHEWVGERYFCNKKDGLHRYVKPDEFCSKGEEDK